MNLPATIACHERQATPPPTAAQHHTTTPQHNTTPQHHTTKQHHKTTKGRNPEKGFRPTRQVAYGKRGTVHGHRAIITGRVLGNGTIARWGLEPGPQGYCAGFRDRYQRVDASPATAPATPASPAGKSRVPASTTSVACGSRPTAAARWTSAPPRLAAFSRPSTRWPATTTR